MTATNTYGRTVVIAATNKSGGGLIAGDVCVVDTTNNLAFTTDTSGSFVGTIGVAQGTIASNNVGLFAISGYVSLVNVNASVTRGHYGKTYTVAKQATDAGASRGVGTFCEFTTAGTTPDAIMWPVDLLSSSLTNPMSHVGALIYGGTAGAPTELQVGATRTILSSDGTNPSWGIVIVRGAVNADGTLNRGSGFTSAKNSTGNYTVTFSTAFSATPSVVVSSEDTDASKLAHVDAVSTTSFVVRSALPNTSLNDVKFNFIAMSV